MNPYSELNPFRVDKAAIHDWNRRNARSRRAYQASQNPQPSLYACTGCARDTRSRTGLCRDCERMSA